MTNDTHPSFQWAATWRRTETVDPHDPEAFAEFMSNDAFPRASQYAPAWVFGNSMAPTRSGWSTT